jgi:hypothetical protein
MKHTFLMLALLASLSATAQIFFEPKAGMSSRLNFSAVADVGYRFYNNVHIAATGGFEMAAGTSIGATVGWLPNEVMPYAGYGYFIASTSKLAEGSRYYPIAGLLWKDSDGRGVCDLRYMGDAFLFTMGVRLGKNY